MCSKKGFTLIEMLVVIAIIAVLVAIIVPTVASSTTKAEAAADAANLRSILGVMNTVLITREQTIEEAVINHSPTESKLIPGADLYVLYTTPGIIDVYYTDGSNFYGLEYLADIAEHGATSLSATVTTPLNGAEWYKVGYGKHTPGT